MNKKNNKGFSLIELIVVVAIMAVLVGVLAPTYLNYVEKTRLQKDNSAIAEVAQAMKIAAADEKVNELIASGGQTITFKYDAKTAKAAVLTYGETKSVLEEAVAQVVPEFTTSSNTYSKAAKDITLTISIEANGAVKITPANMITVPNSTTADAVQPTL